MVLRSRKLYSEVETFLLKNFGEITEFAGFSKVMVGLVRMNLSDAPIKFS